MEILFGVAGLIAAVFVVVFGGRGLVDLVRGASERRGLRTAQRHEQTTTPLPTQDVRFTTTTDGVRIAYAVAGEGPVVFVIGQVTHVEVEWESVLWRHWWAELSRGHTLVRLDHRGVGLSDPSPEQYTNADLVLDLEAVIDAVGGPSVMLMGISKLGGTAAMEYAASHHEQIKRLVLFGVQTRGQRARGLESVERPGIRMLLERGWGRDDPAYRQLWNAMAVHVVPEATPELLEAYREIFSAATSAEGLRHVIDALSAADMTETASKITAPTLVLHSRGDGFTRFEFGREVAALIPNARFVALESNNHILTADEPAFAVFASEVHRFLDGPTAEESGT